MNEYVKTIYIEMLGPQIKAVKHARNRYCKAMIVALQDIDPRKYPAKS